MNESAVQRRLLADLKTEFPDAYIRKIHQTMYSHNGIPDIIGCINGTFIAIEVKVTSGKLSRLQQIESADIAIAGGICLVCYGKEGIKDVLSILRDAAI